MPFPVPVNALLGLAASASWGGGDFSGGMGVKCVGGRIADSLRFVIAAYGMSLAVLLVIVAVRHPAFPHGAPLAWSVSAGLAGGLSLALFYMALSRGAMGASAAISGLLAAAIPAIVSSMLEGRPSTLRLAGFALAGAAIWAIAAGPSPENASTPDGPPAPSGLLGNTFLLAVIGGLGFGYYFVGLRMANSLGVFEPMALARAGNLVACFVLLALLPRVPGQPARAWGLSGTAMMWALGVAVLDTGGNLLFLAATRLGRLDVAAVLSSLYPASTILLAAWRLHERPTGRQVAGMVVALAAVVMIAI